jgi:ligand-binding sensor domain-containing protein
VGLFRYDGAAFKQYRYIPGKNGTLANELITALAVNDQSLFIGTQNGLSILKLDSDSIINFHSGKADPNSPEGFGIADLLWHKDELWILGKDFSLTSYDPNKKLFHRFILQKPDLVTESHILIDIRKLLADRKNADNLWISSTYGLYRFSISNHSSELINPPGRGYFNTQNVYGMSMDRRRMAYSGSVG